MAISPLKKIFLFGHRADADALVRQVHAAGTVHVLDQAAAAEQLQAEPAAGADRPAAEASGRLAAGLSRVEQALAQLRPFTPRPGLKAIFGEERRMSPEQLRQAADASDFNRLVDELGEIESERKSLESEAGRLRDLVEILQPWLPLEARLVELAESPYTHFNLGAVPRARAADLADLPPSIAVETVSDDGQRLHLVVAYRCSDADAAREALQQNEFVPVEFRDLKDSPREESARAQERLEEIDGATERLQARFLERAKQLEELEVVRDALAVQVQEQQARNNLVKTKDTFVLSGWIREADLPALQERLEAVKVPMELVARTPREEDKLPVVLQNNPYVGPFELITRLFGLPKATEGDPTPFMAPFYAVFFGIALSDAGYGIVLALGSWLLGRYAKLKPPVLRGVRMFFFVGLHTIVIGALCGGWFGVDPEFLPGFLRQFMLINPMTDPLSLLLLALGLGSLQIWFGMILGFFFNWKHINLKHAVCTNAPWIIFFASALLYLMVNAGVLPPAWGRPIGWALLGGVVLIVFLTGYESHHFLLRIGAGAYKLYGATSLIGDVLSYSRLMAFGLATAGIGLVVNKMALMLGELPILGPVLMVVLLVFGHLFNLAINSLGGFVHSARLQYIEFFGKFYEGGGEAFSPLRMETRYIRVQT